MLQLYLPFKTPKKITKSGILFLFLFKISQKPMTNEETLGFFKPAPVFAKTSTCDQGCGFLGLGYRLAQKTPWLPMPIPIYDFPNDFFMIFTMISCSTLMISTMIFCSEILKTNRQHIWYGWGGH